MSARTLRRILVCGVILGGVGCVRLAMPADERTTGQRPATAAPAGNVADPDRLMAVVRELASPRHEGRRAGSPGMARSRAYIEQRFREAGLEPLGGGHAHRFPLASYAGRHLTGSGLESGADDASGVNVVGVCPGARPDAPYLLVSAHYDHLGVRDGVLYPGADDNASGVAVLLEVAGTCRHVERRHALLFVAFDAEELDLAGARAFVAEPPVAIDRIALVVNLDMLGRNERRELFVAGTAHHPHLRPPLERVRERARVVLRFGHDTPGHETGRDDDWTWASDHGPFHDAGVPFVYFGVEDHVDYHRPTDTVEAIDARFLADAADTVLDAVDELDRVLSGLPVSR